MVPSKNKNVCVVVLGDVGRSPRMQYHVKSLIEENYNVDLIGYFESPCIDEIAKNVTVKLHNLTQFPITTFPTPAKYFFKTLWQILGLLVTLFSVRAPEYVLVQNPPAIPTLICCYLYCLLSRCKLIIDWHNYTYTILALNSTAGEKSLIVRLAKRIEAYFGRKSYANLCVTEAMKNDLMERWNIEAKVLYDRPPTHFQSLTLAKKHEIFMKLSQKYSEFLTKNSDDFKVGGIAESTAFTQKTNAGDVLLKADRPGLLISSTSWTPDEDFGILLKALEEYEKVSLESTHYPPILCVITGKGPLKDHYLAMIEQKQWKNVKVLTPWLENEDYPLLLGAADLGVCLHWSSSGLDLPMKVVDMFGCGLPVCAHNFKCLDELVQDGKNGFVFDNHEELATQILNWFNEFPNSVVVTNVREELLKNIRKFQSLRWKENWKSQALPLFQ